VLVSANLYPWDVDGDPDAAERIARLGLAEVTLAAAYHGVRAATPFHPRHRIVTRDAAVYYRTNQTAWQASPLRPVEADPAGSFERAAARLRASGLRVNAWAVLSHGCDPGVGNPACCVRNAYGDSYPWALCIGLPAVRDYAAALAAEVAALGDADAIELEACGWYGVDHGSAHDKAGEAASPAARWLLSVCFCPACADAYGQAGADPEKLRAAVCSALDQAFSWGSAATAASPPVPATSVTPLTLAGPDELLPHEAAEVLLRTRAAAAGRLLREVIAAVRAAAPGKPVLVHADPDPRAAGANPGYDPEMLLGPGGADGVVLVCWDPARAAPLVARVAAAVPPGSRIAASLLAVAGLGGRPETLAEQAGAVRAAGATELRLYHAGLASASDLAAIRAFCRPGRRRPAQA
jgi:hypothetical protein